MTLCYKWRFNESPDSQWEKGGIEARIRIPADSPWFDGHFPEAPILPGVAQLGLIHDLLCRAIHRRLPVARVSRVRFKQMIRPDQRLTVAVQKADNSGSHRFRISGEQGLISTGQLWLAAGTKDNDRKGIQGKTLR